MYRAETREQATAALDGLPPLGAKSKGRRRRSHGHADAPGPGWVATRERFRDPGSGQIMRVWVDPVDESRHYLPDA